MVTDTGKALCHDTIKPVNLPEAVNVEEDPAGIPVALRTRRRQKIIAIKDRWRIDDEWWRRAPISRLYYAVMLASGQKVVIYKDLVDKGWYRQ